MLKCEKCNYNGLALVKHHIIDCDGFQTGKTKILCANCHEEEHHRLQYNEGIPKSQIKKKIEKENEKSVFNINYHFVWCPKYRKPILINKIKDFLKDCLDTICEAKG